MGTNEPQFLAGSSSSIAPYGGGENVSVPARELGVSRKSMRNRCRLGGSDALRSRVQMTKAEVSTMDTQPEKPSARAEVLRIAVKQSVAVRIKAFEVFMVIVLIEARDSVLSDLLEIRFMTPLLLRLCQSKK